MYCFILALKTVVNYLWKLWKGILTSGSLPLNTTSWSMVRSFGTRNRCYAYALKPVKAPALWGIMLTISMSKMSSTIIGTQICNSMDSWNPAHVEIWSFTTILSLSNCVSYNSYMPGGSGFQPSTTVSPMSWLFSRAPLLLHLDLADPPPQLATWE